MTAKNVDKNADKLKRLEKELYDLENVYVAAAVFFVISAAALIGIAIYAAVLFSRDFRLFAVSIMVGLLTLIVDTRIFMRVNLKQEGDMNRLESEIEIEKSARKIKEPELR